MRVWLSENPLSQQAVWGSRSDGWRQVGQREREADPGGRKSSMAAIALVLMSGCENLNQVVLVKVTGGRGWEDGLQVETGGPGDGLTQSKQQMEEQRMTSSHLALLNCLASLRTHLCASVFSFVWFFLVCLFVCFLKQSQIYR